MEIDAVIFWMLIAFLLGMVACLELIKMIVRGMREQHVTGAAPPDVVRLFYFAHEVVESYQPQHESAGEVVDRHQMAGLADTIRKLTKAYEGEPNIENITAKY